MKKKIFIVFFVVLFSVFGCASAHKTMLYDNKPAFYSYIIGDVRGNSISVEHEAGVYVTPASCQKTIIALLAYKMFGADYCYETKFYTTEKQQKVHDVVVSFSGDPTLTLGGLKQLFETIGGTTVTGKILLDVSLFKTPPYSPNVMAEDIGTEARPVTSANIDHNLITVKVSPNKRGGKFAIVTNDSEYPVDSSVTIARRLSYVKIAVRNNRIKASGNIKRHHSPAGLNISPMDLDYYLLQKVKIAMKKAKVKGRVVIVRDQSQLPAGLILRNVIKSKPLGSIIPPALKKSDNWIFDNLYIKIIHTPGAEAIESWNDGSAVIKDLVYKYLGVNTRDSIFVDGSGLSRYNKIQPQKLFEILKQGYDITEFVGALPSPGEPKSTLARRTHLLEYIKAKTGNMSGISCLCGYSVNNHPKAFVVVADGFSSSNKRIFPVIDNFINYHLR